MWNKRRGNEGRGSVYRDKLSHLVPEAYKSQIVLKSTSLAIG